MPSDLYKKLTDSVIDHNVNEIQGESGLEKVMTVKLNIDPKVFGQYYQGLGEGAQNDWLSGLLYMFDNQLDMNQGVKLISKTIKDSLFDARTVVVIILRYTQGEKNGPENQKEVG